MRNDAHEMRKHAKIGSQSDQSAEVIAMRTHVPIPADDEGRSVGCAVGGQHNGAGGTANDGANGGGVANVGVANGGAANGAAPGVMTPGPVRAGAIPAGRGTDRTRLAGLLRRVGPN